MVVTPPHLDVYYAPTCAPCRLELPAILGAIEDGKDIRVLIVSDPVRSIADLAAVSSKLVKVAYPAQGANPRDRLRRVGDADGILPFTRSVGGKGRVCGIWRGALTRWRILDLLSRCS